MDEEWIETTVEKLIPGGEGLARINGMAHFIPGALPGERIRARVEVKKKGWARTAEPEILESSPRRREPFCPLYGRCGGCSWQHMDEEAQLEAKAGFCREALVRQGGMTSGEVPEPIPFPSPPRGYRARIRPLILPDRRAAFRAAGSDEAVAVNSCPVAVGEINTFLANPPGRLEPGTEPVVFGSGGHFRVEGIHKKAEAAVKGRRFRFPPGAFFQSNLAILDDLVDFVLDGAGEGGTALDLFGGVGLFGAFLADRFETVIGVDRDRSAASSWRSHVGEGGEFHAVSLSKWLRGATKRSADFLVVDPPRGGLAGDVREGIIAMAPRRMAYVSCNPVTQARDIADFRRAGYRLEGYGLFDLYPQTPHAETVARLVRDGER